MNRRFLAVGAALAVALAACVSVEDERRAGEEMSKEVESKIGLYRGPVEDWEAAVGARLVAQLKPEDRARWQFRFAVVDEEEPNAFALPGGPIYVSRGLLALLTSEDELACVLGHEISHVTERHAAARAEESVLPAILAAPGRIIGVVSQPVGAVVSAPFEVLGQLHLARYSREQESDADRLGARLAARAGYDPRALAAILARLEVDATRLAGEERRPSFFDSHPSTPTRVTDLDARTAKIAWTRTAPLAAWPALVATLDGLPWGENPAQGVFRGSLFLHPDLGVAVRFPERWKTVNTASYAGASGSDDVAIVFTPAGREEPEAQARKSVARLRKDEVAISEQRPVEIDGLRGYLVRIPDRDSDATTDAIWVRLHDRTFLFVATARPRDREVVRATIASLRPLTASERASIDVIVLRAVRAPRRETLAALSKASENAWPVRYTALLNATTPSAELDEGALVKIARHEHYGDLAAGE